MSLIPPNRLRAKLAANELAVGTMIAELRQAAVAQCLANAGFDWAIIDNEHGVFNPESISELARACRQLGVTPIVRVPALTYEQIAQALDGGAQGVMLPRVTHPDQVRFAVQCVKYPPVGGRGSAMGRGHTDYKAGDVVEMMAESNRETMVVVQVETREAVERLDELLAVPGVDVGLIGPNDLSIALGVAGRMRDPVLERAIEAMMAACAKHRVYPAIHTNDAQLTADWAGRGMKMVSISSDVGLLQKAAREAVERVRGNKSPSPNTR
jgi:2-dehydro-3-deoxyglucarate aldolase/4-hydroxy-2-oxoheptanedioate aldolase